MHEGPFCSSLKYSCFAERIRFLRSQSIRSISIISKVRAFLIFKRTEWKNKRVLGVVLEVYPAKGSRTILQRA